MISEPKPQVLGQMENGRKREKPDFWHLLGVTLDALSFWPPDYVKSFLGPYRQWFPPFNRYSEFTIVDIWRLPRTLKFFLDITVPSFSGAPPPLLPEVLTNLLWQPTEIFQRPDHYDSYTSFPDEHWFFINGILTNSDFAQLNAACLTHIFHRPISLIQNTTDGALVDLWECSLGKEWYQNTESATVAMPAIYDALKNPYKNKVVVICHSQGTIIMAVVLRALKALGEPWAGDVFKGREPEGVARGMTLLPTVGSGTAAGAPLHVFQDELPLDPEDFEPLTEKEWEKLEIYCFANCASEMSYTRRQGETPLPWIESFGNEYDLVARLGMLAPDAEERKIHLEGPFYVNHGAWGHLLNNGYLLPIAEHQMLGRKRGGAGDARPFKLANKEQYPDAEVPRLYDYINGGSPKERRPILRIQPEPARINNGSQG